MYIMSQALMPCHCLYNYTIMYYCFSIRMKHHSMVQKPRCVHGPGMLPTDTNIKQCMSVYTRLPKVTNHV